MTSADPHLPTASGTLAAIDAQHWRAQAAAGAATSSSPSAPARPSSTPPAATRCWDAAFWAWRGDGRMLRQQLEQVAEMGARDNFVVGERYDMNHVYYTDGTPWHGAAHYYEYPCVFCWVLFREYLGVRPALDADVEISPRLDSYGTVTLEQEAYQLRYRYA